MVCALLSHNRKMIKKLNNLIGYLTFFVKQETR